MSQKTIEVLKAFKEAHETKKRYRILMGGAGSGKSYFVGQEIILGMMGNANHKWLIVRKTGKSLKYSVYELLSQLISDYDLMQYFTVNKTDLSIQCVTGAKIIMSGLDDVEKLKSITGINRIWVEEASEITESDFNQLDLRMRGQSEIGYQMTLTFNPISELHWIKKKFFDLGVSEAYTSKTTYKDNPFLDDAYLRKLERLEEEDYQYYRIYALGEWGSIGNLIYTNWEKADLSKERNEFDNYFNGVDWGFAEDPFAFIRLHYDKARKTIYITDEIYRRGVHNDEIVGEVIELAGKEVVTCDSAEPKSVADFKRMGVNSKGAKKGKGSVEHGIKFLQGNKIIVDSSCINTIAELTAYKWREDKDGNIMPKPVDKNNHILDALRYALEMEMAQGVKWGWG